MPPPVRILQHIPALTLALAAIAIILAGRSYRVGSLTDMGPGFMPVLAAVLLLLLVLPQFLGGERTDAEATSETQTSRSALAFLRPLLLCSGSILLWVVLAEPAGLIPASLAQLALAHAAVPQASWKAVLAASLAVSVLVYLLFVVLLGVPLQAVG